MKPQPRTKGKEDRLDQVEKLLEQLNADLKILQRDEREYLPSQDGGTKMAIRLIRWKRWSISSTRIRKHYET